MKIRKCRCGNENISLAKMKKDNLWHCICLACGTYLVQGARTKTEAKEMWNKHFEQEEEAK